ncbi:hypothetical protein HY441_01605 [Candidatus Microgenomates bacterium]|nr:hypothetical protein [Candidatus Microgenomates bacterium]
MKPVLGLEEIENCIGFDDTNGMYFRDRHEAGAKLAAELRHYRYENTAVLALSDGAVLVGDEIARALHCTISLLLTEPITLKDIGGETIGVIDQAGTFTFNNLIPAGLLEEIMAENRTVVEEEKMKKLHAMTKLLSEHGLAEPQLFYGHNVIIVSDGLKSGLALEAAVNFLKPIKTGKLIGAAPLASVQAVDRLHVLCDEIHVLSVVDNYLDTNHYYKDNTIGDTKAIIDSINRVVMRWA